MPPAAEPFLAAATTTVALLRTPEVADAWFTPSALPEFAVSGLAGHLAWQILMVPDVLIEPVPDEAPASLLDHYRLASWIGTDVNDEFNVRIRDIGEEFAAGGAVALADRTESTVDMLRQELSAQPADRLVRMPGRSWSLRLDDFLITRLMEVAVHCDDLAVSVEVPTPTLPGPVLEPVFALLCSLAVQRHGQTAVLRALSRAERAPASIVAF